MATVPSNLIPSRITQLPEAPVADPAGYFPIVINGVTYKVQFSQINQNLTVPPSRAINAGTGLTGGGTLSHDITIAVANGGIGDNQLDNTGVSAGTYGDGQTIPVITVNNQGRVTSLSTVTVAQADVVPTSRQIIAGEGLAGGGNLTANRTLSIDFSSTNPVSLGVASPGTGTKAAREDHVHPALDLSDTSEITGTLPLGRGGTGSALSPVPGAIAYSSGSELVFGSVGSIGQILVSGGNGAYTWGTALVIAPVAANLVYAGPASGGDADSAFRALVNADIPATLTDKTISSAVISNAFSISTPSATITNLIATTATISDLSATVGTVGTLDGSSWTVTNFTATSATISNFTFTSSTVTDLTATNLTATSATITKLTSPSANITTLLTSSGTITNLVATTASVSDLSATVGRVGSGTITNLASTSATITTLTATSATIDNFTFTSATVTRLGATSAVISDLSATVGRVGSGTITNLLATTASITDLSATVGRVGSGTITQLTSTSASITTLTGTSASITNLTADSLVLSNLSIASANVTTLTSDSSTITNLIATTASITDLSATVGRIGSATITDLAGTSASITTLSGTALGYSSGNVTVLTSDSATLTNLVATSGTITTLTSTSATVTNLGVTSLTVSSLSLSNATFTSATITTLTSTSATITTLSGTSLTITGATDLQNQSNSAITVKVKNTNILGKSGIQFDDQLSANSGSVYYDNPSATFVLGGNSGVSTVFNANGNEEMRLTSTGLGIGKTPSTALDVSGTITGTNITITGEYSGTISGGTY